MARCAMCCNEYDGDSHLEIDEKRPICDSCGKVIDTLLNAFQPTEYRNAVNYIHNCREQADDPMVEAFLLELLENSAAEPGTIDELSAKDDLSGWMDDSESSPETPISPVRFDNDVDCNQRKASSQETADCSGPKVIRLAKLTLVLGIIASILWAIILWAGDSCYASAIGFGILIGGIAASFLVAISLQAFGELLQDTHENKALLKKQVELLKKQVALLKEQPFQSAAESAKGDGVYE